MARPSDARIDARLGLIALVTLAACAPHGADDGTPLPFEPFAGDATAPDVTTDRLCDEAADPDAAPDPQHIHCRLEGASFSEHPAPPDTLSVMVWNLERGQQLDAQLAAWADGSLPVPDILLASELDRGCTRSGVRNVPREIAEALGLDYVFATEFLELPRESGSGGRIDAICEHGNAVFSRFPLGNAQRVVHTANLSWYIPPAERDGTGEPRLGGRTLAIADTRIGDDLLGLVSLHFESKVSAHDIQVAQAQQTADLASSSPVPVLVGGDTNNLGYAADVSSGAAAAGTPTDDTIGALVGAGLVDAHRALASGDRATHSPGLILDLLLGRDVTFADPWVCGADVCDPLSDHRAIGAEATPAW